MRCDRIAKDHSVPTMYPINFIHSHGICWLNLIRSNGEHKAFSISTRVNSIFTVSTRQEIMSNQQKKPVANTYRIECGKKRGEWNFILKATRICYQHWILLIFNEFQRKNFISAWFPHSIIKFIECYILVEIQRKNIAFF